MGSQIGRFEFKPGENQQIETVIRIPEERRSVVHGVVLDHCDNVVEDAVVKLFEVQNPHDPCSLKPITHTFTDKCGEFLLGPLTPHKHYVIIVWANSVKIRPIGVHRDDDDDFDDGDDYEDEYRLKDDIDEAKEYEEHIIDEEIEEKVEEKNEDREVKKESAPEKPKEKHQKKIILPPGYRFR